jgi:hypothetical protein
MLEIAGSTKAAAGGNNATVPADGKALSDIAPANATVRNFAMAANVVFDVSKYAAAALTPANLFVQTTQLKKRWSELGKRQEAPASASASASRTTDDRTAANADDPTAGIVTANATTFQQSYLPFLFLNPAMPSSQLCQPCTQAVMASYIAFESIVPYAGGLPKSYLLAGQSSFWKALGSACGDSFLSAINTQAGQAPAFSSGAASLVGSLGLATVGLAAALLTAL